MGLDTTHDAWHGGYGSFHNWRTWLAEQIGIPLELMEAFYEEKGTNNPFVLLDYKFPKGDELEMSSIRRFRKMLPLKWSAFRPCALHTLLHHSDCDGEIAWEDCGEIAKELKELLTQIENDNANSKAPEIERGNYDGMYKATERFMKGCELAFSKKENIEFH